MSITYTRTRASLSTRSRVPPRTTDNHPVLVLHGEDQVEVWQYYSKFTGAQGLVVTIGRCNPSQRSYEPRPTLLHSHPRIWPHYLLPVDLPSHQTDTPPIHFRRRASLVPVMTTCAHGSLPLKTPAGSALWSSASMVLENRSTRT